MATKTLAPRVPLVEIVDLLPKTSGESGKILRRIAAFEVRRLFLRGARRLRKIHGKKSRIAFRTASTNGRTAGIKEREAIEIVLDGGTVEVVARSALTGKVVGSRNVGKWELQGTTDEPTSPKIRKKIL